MQQTIQIYGLEDISQIAGIATQTICSAIELDISDPSLAPHHSKIKTIKKQQQTSKDKVIFVKQDRADSQPFVITPQDNYKIIKKRLSIQMDIDPCTIILIYKGRNAQQSHPTPQDLPQKSVVHLVDPQNLVYRMGKINIEKTFASSSKQVHMSSDETISKLYEYVERQILINRDCFKLYHMGCFLSQQKSLRQAFICRGTEVKVIISQKKLTLVRCLGDLFNQFMVELSNHEEEAATLEDSITSQDILSEIMSQIKEKARKVGKLKLIQERYTLDDAYQEEVAQNFKKYKSIMTSADQLDEDSPVIALSTTISLLNKYRQFDINTFLLDYVMFNRQRKNYFFKKLEQIISSNQNASQKLQNLLNLFQNDMLNKANFAKIQRLCGHQIETLAPHTRLLIETLYQGSAAQQIEQYLSVLQQNTYCLEGMPDLMIPHNNYIFLDPKAIEQLNTQYEVQAQISAISCILALHFPIFKYRNSEKVAKLREGVKENLANLENNDYIQGIVELLFTEEFGSDYY